MTPPKATRQQPADAMSLLLDPEHLEYACNFYENPAFHHANQRTRAYRDERMVDAYRHEKDPKVWAEELREFLLLPLDEFTRRVNAEHPVTLTRIDKLKPWNLAQGAEREKRPIVKATFFRRCLSNIFTFVLEATADRLLPKEAIAYRRGRKDVICRAIIEAAQYVTRGGRHWAKLDIKNFFGSVPWSGMRRALVDIGFPELFTAKLMVLVQSTIVERRFGRWWTVANEAGTQAGLRESAVLANLFLAGLDRDVSSRFRCNFYRRYSDDILIIAKRRADAEGAVNIVRAWLSDQGLELKGAAR